VGEMDEILINNWNSKVSNEDLVYHLGDFCMGDPNKYLDRLNGTISFIRGSHDKKIKYCKKIKEINDMKTINIDGNVIILCHYCLKTWPRSHYNTIHLFGHSHGHLKEEGKSLDVGVDSHNFSPLSLNEVITIMKNKPDNFNFVDNRQ
jgi:calcineurin-like phosphoesterase family protein